MIPPKLSKPPLRRIVEIGAVDSASRTDYHSMRLDCGHYVARKPPKGLMESWRRVRCKECVR